MLAVNNADEIRAVRILYVCQISIVGQSNTQHIIHRAIVAISKIAVTIIRFLSLAAAHSFSFYVILRERTERPISKE